MNEQSLKISQRISYYIIRESFLPRKIPTIRFGVMYDINSILGYRSFSLDNKIEADETIVLLH